MRRLERLDLMLGFRAAMVLIVLAAPALAGSLNVPSLGRAAVLAAAYLLVAAPLELLARWARPARLGAVGALFAVDATFVVLVLETSAGPRSALALLAPLHLVTATLLASYRTGLRLAATYAVLLVAADVVQRAGLAPAVLPPEQGDGVEAAVWALALLLVAGATAAFSAVNERELRRRTDELGQLVSLAHDLESVASIEDTVDRLLHRVVEGLDHRSAAVVLLRGRGSLVTAWRAEPLETGSVDAVVADAVRSRVPQLVRRLDPVADPALSAVLPEAEGAVVLPLVTEDQPLGALVALVRQPGNGMAPRDVALLRQVAAHGALAVRSAQLLGEVEALARTDPLTGLANRRELDRVLDIEVLRAERSEEPLAVVVLDLDHFKEVNDRHGHQTGDQVLRAAGKAVRSVLRRTDTAARYGGEEMVLVLPQCTPDEAVEVAERVRAALAAAAPVPVTASAGVACWPDHGRDPAALVAAADTALYRAKAGGRDRTEMAGPGPRRRARRAATRPPG